jgi:calcium-dependent protein kinase
VLEYCLGGELFDKIIKLKSLSEMRTAKIMQQILSAIVYCHSHNICHRDLKPENLLLEEDSIDSNIKVIDFGTSKWFKKNERMKEKFGTPYYIAPEVLKKDYNEKCDVWSCGVILYIMLSGYPPFGGKNNEQIMKKVLEGSFNFNKKEWNIISDKAKLLITKMLTYSAEVRISAETALSDIWISQYSQKIKDSTFKSGSDEVAQSMNMLRNFKVSSLFSYNRIYKLLLLLSMRLICRRSQKKSVLGICSNSLIRMGMEFSQRRSW